MWVLLRLTITKRESAVNGTHGFSSLCEKTKKSNHLQMSLQRQHFLLSDLKTLRVGLGGIWTGGLPLGIPAPSQLSQPGLLRISGFLGEIPACRGNNNMFTTIDIPQFFLHHHSQEWRRGRTQHALGVWWRFPFCFVTKRKSPDLWERWKWSLVSSFKLFTF